MSENPNSYVLNLDGTKVHVTKDQIWAVYDCVADEMPRIYYQIDKVTQAPFHLEAVLLEPTPFNGTSIDWLLNHNLLVSTGKFRLNLGGKTECKSTVSLSHLMDIKYNKDGIYNICPKRSEVWAIYEDYGKEVSRKDADGKMKLRYDLVLITSDFQVNTGTGNAVRLQNLKGYKTFWVPYGKPYQLTDMDDRYKFSHQVPEIAEPAKDDQGVITQILV